MSDPVWRAVPRIEFHRLREARLQAHYAAQWLARKKGEIGGVTYLAYKSAVNGFVEETPSKAKRGASPGPSGRG